MTLHIEKLTRYHAVEQFDCGQEPLNRFLVRFAWGNQQAQTSQTYLALSDERVIGFYTLVVGEVAYDNAPERLVKGLARHPVPIMLLARLAVDKHWQGKKIGAGLLKDAMVRTARAADIAGIRSIAVHAKDETACAFYRHFNFSPSPVDPFHLFLLIKDVRKMITAERNASTLQSHLEDELNL